MKNYSMSRDDAYEAAQEFVREVGAAMYKNIGVGKMECQLSTMEEDNSWQVVNFDGTSLALVASFDFEESE